MPHSSSGYGEVKVNRTYLLESEAVKEGADGKLSLSGQESAPPTTVAMVTWLHGQVSGLEIGKVIPVTFRDKSERNGYYAVNSASSELTDFQNEVALADWSIELDRLGSDSEVDLQSRLTGTARQNDHSLSGVKWHAPSYNHYAYHTGTTVPSDHSRPMSDGNSIRVYTGIPSNTSPKWGCAVTDYHKGAVTVQSTTYVTSENDVEGINRSIGVSGWTLTNGIINVSPTATAGRLTVGLWNSPSFRNQNWDIQVGGSNVLSWQSISILRNDPEQVVIRLVSNRSAVDGGRDSLDLSLRRGSMFVEGYLQTSSSATLGITPNATYAATSGTGFLRQTTTTNTIQAVCGSAKSFSPTPGTGAISKSSVTSFDFWIGATVGAGSTGTAATDLRDQYIGTMPEVTYAVRR